MRVSDVTGRNGIEGEVPVSVIDKLWISYRCIENNVTMSLRLMEVTEIRFNE